MRQAAMRDVRRAALRDFLLPKTPEVAILAQPPRIRGMSDEKCLSMVSR